MNLLEREKIAKLNKYRKQLVEEMNPLFGICCIEDDNYKFKEPNTVIAKQLGYAPSEISRFLTFPKIKDKSQPQIDAYKTIIRVVKAVAKKDKELNKQLDTENDTKESPVSAEDNQALEELKAKVQSLEEKNKELANRKKPFFEEGEVVGSGCFILFIFFLILIGLYHRHEIIIITDSIRNFKEFNPSKHEMIISNVKGIELNDLNSPLQKGESLLRLGSPNFDTSFNVKLDTGIILMCLEIVKVDSFQQIMNLDSNKIILNHQEIRLEKIEYE